MIINTSGGGTGLNFKVVGGTTQPGGGGGGSAPKENTIWVNTATKITSWEFSATQPTGVEGMVWIQTGTASQTPFNALKKNGITVYPLSAKQYVGGAWVTKDAKVYQGGAWKSWWRGELYIQGDDYSNITGGFEAKAVGYQDYAQVAPTIVSGETSMRLELAKAGIATSGVVMTKKAVDLSDFTKLVFKGSTNLQYEASGRLCVFRDVYASGDHAATLNLRGVSEGNLDVSALSGTYHVGFHILCTNNNGPSVITVNELYLE